VAETKACAATANGDDLARPAFLQAMADQCRRAGLMNPDLDRQCATALSLFCRDEMIHFGNSRFAWDREAAAELAEDYILADADTGAGPSWSRQ